MYPWKKFANKLSQTNVKPNGKNKFNEFPPKMAEKLIYPNFGNHKIQYWKNERKGKIANIFTLTVKSPHKIMMVDVRKYFEL